MKSSAAAKPITCWLLCRSYTGWRNSDMLTCTWKIVEIMMTRDQKVTRPVSTANQKPLKL